MRKYKNIILTATVMFMGAVSISASADTIKIGINYEHTLVKEGGRSVPKGTPFGNIKYNENENYLVRIDKLKHLNSCDIIIDYSNPNIANVKESGLFSDFSNKHIYVAPFLYKNLYINTNNREENDFFSILKM